MREKQLIEWNRAPRCRYHGATIAQMFIRDGTSYLKIITNGQRRIIVAERAREVV